LLSKNNQEFLELNTPKIGAGDTLFIFLVLCALGYAYPRAYLHALNRGLVFMEPRARVQEAINMRPILDALRTHVQTLELPLDKSGIVIESLALRLKVQQLVQAPVISVAYFIRERPLVFESDAVVVGCTRVLNTLSFFGNRDTVTIIVLHAPETKIHALYLVDYQRYVAFFWIEAPVAPGAQAERLKASIAARQWDPAQRFVDSLQIKR